MDGAVSEMLEDFISSPLVTWVQTVEGLLDSRADRPASPQEKPNHESPKEYFLKLVSGDFLICIMEMIDMIHGGAPPSWNEQSPELYRLQILQILLQRLNSFYQNDLQQQILSLPPNIYLLAQDPLTAQAIAEMKKLLLLLLGCAIQCERRDEFIGCIQTLDITTQAALVSAIQEVTQEPENMLRLNWKETGPRETEQLLQNVVQLVRERDAGLEKLWELQQERKTQPVPPPENNQQHLGVQMAEVRAQVRHLRHELEEKMEELLDQQDEQKVLEEQLKKLKQENRALAGEAHLAGLYRDEADALREKALRTERLQAELAALRELLPALEECRAQLKEERMFSQALLETKAMLEGQVEAARPRGQQLSQVEKEKLHLQSCLNQVQEEREHLYQQVDELLRENVALERQLRKSLGETTQLLRAEEIEHGWPLEEPSGGPFLLSYEIETSDRLLPLERENQELRRKLHEALELREMDPEAKRTVLDHERKSPQSQTQQEMGRKISDPSEVPGQKGHEGLVLDKRESQRWKQGGKVALAEETELQARLQEAEWQQESESRRASDLEDALRVLREDCAAALEKREHEWNLEMQHLREEIQALEREQEALRAGSRALQAAATQAQSELSEVRQRLQEERLQGSLGAQKAHQAQEELCAARQELDALHRSQEQHKANLAQLEAEKATLEEMLSQAENRWRQMEKDARHMKVQNQAQEEALAAQGGRLVHPEAQTQEQAVEDSILWEIPSWHRQDSEREAADLGGQVDTKREASAKLEEANRGSGVPPFPDPEAQLPVSPSNPKTDELTLQADARTEVPSARVIEVERENAALQAEKLALTERIGHLETQFNHLRASCQGQSPGTDKDHEKWQAQNSVLQVEAALLHSQQALLESQLSELRQRLAGVESAGQAAQREREEWRRRYETLLRDHDRLTVLHERQGADLEGLLAKHRSLKGTWRSLEQEYRDLQSRLGHLMGQKTDLEQREEALGEQKKRLEEEGRHHRELVEHHNNLKKEHERVKQALSQTERARDDLQGELHGMRNRITGLQLEQVRLEAESTALKEQSQQLDTALGRMSTQCELLAQLKGNQEEENRHLLEEIQSLSRENRRLLERSMESREHFQEEQRQYLDKLGELRREKQKLVEKIMDQYRVLDPALPRFKKSNWIAEKIRKLMKPRREAVREQLRPMAEGAGSTESLSGQEGQGADGTVLNSPSSLPPLRKTTSSLSVLDAQQIHLRRRRLSSHMPAASAPGVGDGEGQDTPRQRFRQRRLGMLGGSREEAVIATVEWQAPIQEKRGPPLGEEEKNPTCSL